MPPSKRLIAAYTLDWIIIMYAAPLGVNPYRSSLC